MSVALGRLSLTITMAPPARPIVAEARTNHGEASTNSRLERWFRRDHRLHDVDADRMRWLMAAQRFNRW